MKVTPEELSELKEWYVLCGHARKLHGLKSPIWFQTYQDYKACLTKICEKYHLDPNKTMIGMDGTITRTQR